jgi:osmotically-inducible protein OsmY
VLVAVLGLVLLGYLGGLTWRSVRQSEPIGTSGVIDAQKARERGAELGERAAVATARVRDAVADSSLTGKIKAKMALDDLVNARAIDVTTVGSVVTLSGAVHSAAERDRALSLSRETEGVEQVIDNLRVVQ